MSTGALRYLRDKSQVDLPAHGKRDHAYIGLLDVQAKSFALLLSFLVPHSMCGITGDGLALVFGQLGSSGRTSELAKGDGCGVFSGFHTVPRKD